MLFDIRWRWKLRRRCNSEWLDVGFERLFVLDLNPFFLAIASDLCRSQQLLGTTNHTGERVWFQGLKGLLAVGCLRDYRLAPGRVKLDFLAPLGFLALIFDT